MIDLNLARTRRYLRPTRVFLIAALLGLLFGFSLRFLFRPLLTLIEQALYYRITKPLEIIQGPLTGILGTKEAVTAFYLLMNNLLVCIVAAFGGVALIHFTMKPEEEYNQEGRVTNFLHRLVGEGNETYKEHSTILFLLPLAVVFVNGAVLGLFSVSQGLSFKELSVYLAYIIPHGVIELPAVVFASTIGYVNALRLNEFLDKGDIRSFFEAVNRTLRSRRIWGLFSLVILMLVSAAAIETYVTPVVGRNALRKAYFSLEMLNESVRQGEPAFLVLSASFDSTITFHEDSPSGPQMPVDLIGSDRFPFEVTGRRIADGEAVKASQLHVPGDVGVFLLKFRAHSGNESLVIHVVAEHGKIREEANLTVLP